MVITGLHKKCLQILCAFPGGGSLLCKHIPDSLVGKVFQAPSDFPGGKAGDVLTVEFTICGVPRIGLKGGDVFKHSEAFSFQIATDDQAKTGLKWNAITDNGGRVSECG